MPSAQQKFWKLVIDGRLLTLDECQQLHAEFVQVSSTPPDDAAALAKWLVKQGVLSLYQARVLLAGRAGPFWLGDYKILDRYGDGQIKNLYEALGRTDGQRVLLLVVPQSAGQDRAKLQALVRSVQKSVAPTVARLNSSLSFVAQGSLAYAMLAELSPPSAEPTVEPAAAEPAPYEPTEPAEELPSAAAWAPEIPLRRSRVKRRSLRSTLVGWGVALVLLMAAGGAWLVMTRAGDSDKALQPASPVATDEQTEGEESEANQVADAVAAEDQFALGLRPPAGSTEPAIEKVADDGQTLWASPTAGPPLDIGHLPAGPEAVLVLRPAELAESVEGAKILEAIGPAAAAAAEAIHAITLCQWPEIEQLQVGFYPAGAGPVRVAFVIRLAASLPPADWKTRLSQPTSTKHAGQEYFQAGDWAYYLPESEDGRLVVVASPTEINELIDAGVGPLTKEMERILADTDAARHVTLLGEPFSIFREGQMIFAGPLARLAQPLHQFLGDGVQALLVSGYVGEDLFLELRAYGQADKDPRQLADHYRAELAKLPSQFEAYLTTLDPAPYGRAVLVRFPRMLDQLQRFTRAAAEHHQAVLRCYLPAIAAHNLLMGTELALAEVPKTQAPAGKEAGKKAGGVETALQKNVSLSFPRDTLEKSLEMLSTEIGVEIVILGPDLQLEGITKNQSFGLDERDQPGREILLKILKLANSDGKLVYVIKPRPTGGDPIIFVTTRAAVKKRGDSLPAGLEKN